MFKKIIAVLLLALVLCSCNAEETPEPVLPEEPVASEVEIEEVDFDALRKLLEYPAELNATPCDFEGGYPYKAAETDVPVEVEELLYRMRRAGEFENAQVEDEKMIFAALTAIPMVSKYDLEPELAEKLAPLFEEIGDECFYPKEWVEIAAGEIFSGRKEFEHQSLEDIGFIYHEKAGVYTPPHLGMNTVIPYIVSYSEDGRFCTAEFFYMEASMSGYSLGDGDIYVSCDSELNEDIFKKPKFIEFAESGKDLYVAHIIKEDDGSYEINDLYKKVVEPELIAEHIAALNEAAREFFGAECVQNMYYSFYFKEENTDWNTVPDMVSEEYLGDSTEEYYYDYFERTVMEVTNFKTKSEVREYMSRWLDSSLFEADYCGIDFNFMEFEGKLYLLRGNRGYGMSYYGDSEIVEQTETEMTAVAKIYRIIKNEAGTAEIKFEKIDGRWIIVSVEDNYY